MSFLHPHTVIPQIQVTLNCNLDCAYCFQKHSGKIVDFSIVEIILGKTISNNLNIGQSDKNNVVRVYWHGGEPLLAGFDFFRKIVEFQSQYPEILFENRIQTNGTLMTNQLARFFSEHQFAVGFSLDGPEELHNRHRPHRLSGEGSFGATMRGIEIYRRHALQDIVPVIAVVTRSSIGLVGEIYEFFKKLGARVQLDIFDLRSRDFTRDRDQIFEMSPSSEEVGQFLINLFDLWFYDQTTRVDFNELSNEVKIILQPDLKMGKPFHKKRCDFRRMIFDPNGRAFSCDQYVNDERTALGNICKDSMKDILLKKDRLWQDIKYFIRKAENQIACSFCEWGSQCVGGCMTCMKYNALLLKARAKGLPDHHWAEMELDPSLSEIKGETYYCDGLRAFRQHVKAAVQQELSNTQ